MMTFHTLCDRAWSKFWEGSKNAPSQASILKRLRATFGDRKISTITTALVEDIASKWQREGSSAKTCNRHLSSLGKMLKWAERRGELERAPYIERFKEGIGRLRVVTGEEEAEVLRHLTIAGRPDFADIVACLVDTGMRRDELLSLLWEQIEDGWVLLEDTKNGRPRRIPLTQRASKILESYRDQEGGPFLAVAKSTFSDAWNKAKAAMGIEDKGFVPHSLRHTFASRLLERRADLFTVSRLLGHTSIKTTADVYGHLSPDRAEEAVALLEPGAPDSGH